MEAAGSEGPSGGGAADPEHREASMPLSLARAAEARAASRLRRDIRKCQEACRVLEAASAATRRAKAAAEERVAGLRAALRSGTGPRGPGPLPRLALVLPARPAPGPGPPHLRLRLPLRGGSALVTFEDAEVARAAGAAAPTRGPGGGLSSASRSSGPAPARPARLPAVRTAVRPQGAGQRNAPGAGTERGPVAGQAGTFLLQSVTRRRGSDGPGAAARGPGRRAGLRGGRSGGPSVSRGLVPSAPGQEDGDPGGDPARERGGQQPGAGPSAGASDGPAERRGRRDGRVHPTRCPGAPFPETLVRRRRGGGPGVRGPGPPGLRPLHP
ncbi:interferon-induced 35 kDa protein isoform X1 [Ornithorhynchus anatinus]|uniref:interferon-induced 35 kDa protein isoform X1 n=1 Tax=Ornithorhynchus anatinus TaxID=9258 RepID=UPI0019D4B568|nr:interferon-induced 35 kDa protein isoform X1 [Ornithorhynchus anatinus]